MHQDATWYGDRPQPRRLCVRWGPSPRPQKGAEPPIFDPRLLWPNGWMDEDATWYGSRPWHRSHCIIRRCSSCLRMGHNSPPPLFAHVYCGHGRPSHLLLSSCTSLYHMLSSGKTRYRTQTDQNYIVSAYTSLGSPSINKFYTSIQIVHANRPRG